MYPESSFDSQHTSPWKHVQNSRVKGAKHTLPATSFKRHFKKPATASQNPALQKLLSLSFLCCKQAQAENKVWCFLYPITCLLRGFFLQDSQEKCLLHYLPIGSLWSIERFCFWHAQSKVRVFYSRCLPHRGILVLHQSAFTLQTLR